MENVTVNLERESPAEFDSGNVTWILACTAVTWLMVPGVGFFYNGMAQSKSSLSLIISCFWTVAIISIQWYIIGYSLCLSNSGNFFIGNVDHALLRNVGLSASVANPEIPAMLVGIWYCLFAVITPTIILGAGAERARLLPFLVFVFFWSTLVFDVLTYWTWNPKGWTYQLGALDFAGGTPVHISTGAAALAYGFMLGPRRDTSERPPHNMTHVIIGTSFIWFGWLIANAGSGLAPNMRAVTVFITTNMSASAGGITWAFLEYCHTRKFSALGFCTGVVCGLVAITPASGYVSESSSLAFGVVGSLCCNFATKWRNHWMKLDDAFDVFTVHGIGGIVGNLLTGVFAQKSIALVDGTEIDGGGLDGNWSQMYLQCIDTVAGLAWSFFVTLAILFVINNIPGLHLRAEKEDEDQGLDDAELGQTMYQHVADFSNTFKKILAANISSEPVIKNGGELNSSTTRL